MEDFEILTMILSALVWQKNGGSIKMVTDDQGARYFSSRGLEKLWNGGIETPLNNVPKEIDPFLFWAGGKLIALDSQNESVCMIDTDMIVWRECESIEDLDIVAAHREDIMPDVYPDKEYFRMKPEYSFPDWDWQIRPCNTAFLYIKDLEFRRYYVERSIEFMKNLREDSNVVIPMVFAEQRLLAMCAKEKDKEINTLLQLGRLKSQRDVTHVWGHKNSLRADPRVRADYCKRCIRRIRQDFPECAGMLESVAEIVNHLWSMDVDG